MHMLYIAHRKVSEWKKLAVFKLLLTYTSYTGTVANPCVSKCNGNAAEFLWIT